MKITEEDIKNFKEKYPNPDNDDLYRFAEKNAIKMQNESISPAIKEKSPLYCISEFGKCHIKEKGKDIGENYTVIFDVSSLGAYKDMYVYYMLCLIDKVNPKFTFDVTFRFDRHIDIEYLEPLMKKAKYFLYTKMPLNTIRLEPQKNAI